MRILFVLSGLICAHLLLAGCHSRGPLSKVPASTPKPFLGAYVHIDQCFKEDQSVPEKEKAIHDSMVAFKASGLHVVMPYLTTTPGLALYPSAIMPVREGYRDWDPVAVFEREAHAQGLEFWPALCVLPSGIASPKGILLQHPDFAIKDKDGKPLGHISPCNPEAREWVTSVVKEIVSRYKSDGLLLDYLRFPNEITYLDDSSDKVFRDGLPAGKVLSATEEAQALHEFKKEGVTELAGMISKAARKIRPGIRIGMYTWGAHVAKKHPVAQDWPTWAEKGYVDMVNVSGYCYKKNYGDKYLEICEKKMREAKDLLEGRKTNCQLTFCLGVRTSHGEVASSDDIADYLGIAKSVGMDGVVFFTWAYMEPYLNEMQRRRLLDKFLDPGSQATK